METNVEKKITVMRISRPPSRLQNVTDQKQVKSVKYFNSLGSMITNDRRCTREMKSRIAMAKGAFNKEKAHFIRKLVVYIRKNTVKCYIWSTVLYGAETWKLRKVEQKYMGSVEMWSWRKMERISWTDCV